MQTGFVPIVILLVLAGAFGVLSLVVSWLLTPKRKVKAKLDPYECGIEPVRLPAKEQFPVKFYVVAMLFIIFDIETIFMYPWAVAYRSLGLFGLVEMIVFVLDRPREKTAGLDLKHLAFQRLRAHKHRLRSFNVAGDLGKT